jgi:hypothetical protein
MAPFPPSLRKAGTIGEVWRIGASAFPAKAGIQVGESEAARVVHAAAPGSPPARGKRWGAALRAWLRILATRLRPRDANISILPRRAFGAPRSLAVHALETPRGGGRPAGAERAVRIWGAGRAPAAAISGSPFRTRCVGRRLRIVLRAVL